MTVIASIGWIAPGAQPAFAQTADAVQIKEASGVVEILSPGATNWIRTTTGQELHPFDFVRTRANSSVGIWMTNTVLRFPELSEVQILPGNAGDGQDLKLIQGLLSFFHRDKPGRIRVLTNGGVAGVKGTEFVMAVATTNLVEQTTISVIDGEVLFTNAGTMLLLSNGQQAVGTSNDPPHRIAGFNATNLLQWCFYYPCVLDLDELPLTGAETNPLKASLAAYRAGDVLAALSDYPAARQPQSDAERVYLAELLLSVGQVESSEAQLSAMTKTGADSRDRRLASALYTLIAAVKRGPRPLGGNEQLSSELLAASYYEQSLAGPKALDRALALARAATNSPEFGFAWERVAELEFSFGLIDRAWADLQPALEISPRNAQALALRGFLLAAQNRIREAIASFDEALAVDSALGNAWLGRGLCRIRRGESKGGRQDLLIAAAMEPRRASLRSYLGKALGDAGDKRRAIHELNLAKQLDPNDPAAWLYSALLAEDNNRLNDAVSDLEESQALNNNRRVYRSDLLLDQDRAVRGANLARIYDEAGLTDVSVWEANQAVEADYDNYSAHLFLANSYDRLREQSPVDLRYETPAYSEYLLASLLGPADGRLLAQPVSQGEYTSLLERDGPGLFSSVEYLGRGAYDQYTAQYGTFKDTSYALEEEYASDPGELPDQDSTSHLYSFKLKQALTPHDQVFAQVQQYEQSGGDLDSVYSATNINRSFRSSEKQNPNLVVGYHHDWAPGQDTLFLFSRFNDSYDYSIADEPAILEYKHTQTFPPLDLNTANQENENLYSAELQHIWQTTRQTLIAGGRYQWGVASEQNVQTDPSAIDDAYFPNKGKTPLAESVDWNFSRWSVYAYDHWHLCDALDLIGGLSFDRLTLPRNDASPPPSPDSKTESQLSPKLGFVWTPTSSSTFRGAFTRSLGGFNLDQSLSLEPPEIAGFVQSYRSLIPESLGGRIDGAKFETFDLAYEQTLLRHTYLALSAELLYSSANPEIGEFDYHAFASAAPSSLPENLDFREWSWEGTLDQIISRDLTLGLDYRLSNARFSDGYPGLPPAPNAADSLQSSVQEGLLQSLLIHATFNHPSGFFAQLQGRWTAQSNFDADSSLKGDNFWQFDLLAGYRFPRRHAVISVGVLNFTGQNYHLNPVNLYVQLPRSSTFVCRFQISF
jgi:Tfp pilus assembly protein PilF